MIRTLVLATLLAISASSASATATDPHHPVVQGFGAITPMPDAKERPDRSLRYRILFSITKPAATAELPNPSLERVARFINLLGAEGVRPKSGDVVVIVHQAAVPLVLKDVRFAERFKVAANPNLPLIAALRSAGVSVRVCSQALVGNRIDAVDVADGVDVDVSAVTTLATLQLRGWALIPD